MRSASLALTLLGSSLSLIAIVLASCASLRTRRRLARDIKWARESNQQMVDASNQLPWGEARDDLQSRWNDDFEARFGHRPDRRMAVDNWLSLERMQLMVADAQVKDLRGPALLVVVGIIMSTVGSVLSLWA